MLLVCLSHVKEHVIDSAPLLYQVLLLITRVATPTFLLLSGFVIAHVLRNSTQPRIGLALVDRGLFLLLVAHVLIGLAELPEMGFYAWLFERTVITDAIGVALCVAVVVRHASSGALLAAGSALALLSWPIGMMLSADGESAQSWAGILFSLRNQPDPHLDAPLIPYLGVFLVGMGLSVRYNEAFRARDNAALSRRLLAAAAISILAVSVGVATWFALRELHGGPFFTSPLGEVVREALDPRVKWPPSPAYLLFYGSAGLTMAALLLRVEGRRRWHPLVANAAILGRASLMCFVVQDWLLRLLPQVLALNQITTPVFWAFYLAASLWLLLWLAKHWDAASGNRWLSVGLRTIVPLWTGPQPWRLPDGPALDAAPQQDA